MNIAKSNLFSPKIRGVFLQQSYNAVRNARVNFSQQYVGRSYLILKSPWTLLDFGFYIQSLTFFDVMNLDSNGKTEISMTTKIVVFVPSRGPLMGPINGPIY